MICISRQRSTSLLYTLQRINDSWYEDSGSLLNSDESHSGIIMSFHFSVRVERPRHDQHLTLAISRP